MSDTLVMDQNVTELLGDDAESLLSYECQGIPKKSLHLPVAGCCRSNLLDQRSQAASVGQPAADFRQRTAERYGLCFHPAGGPGNRAFGWRIVRPQSDLF